MQMFPTRAHAQQLHVDSAHILSNYAVDVTEINVSKISNTCTYCTNKTVCLHSDSVDESRFD